MTKQELYREYEKIREKKLKKSVTNIAENAKGLAEANCKYSRLIKKQYSREEGLV